MTIQSSTNKTIALGNGAQTQFAFDFVGVAAAYIEVIYTDASGNETVLTQGAGATQYQIALNAPVQGAVWGLGGTVTYNPSGTPIPTGSSLTIFRTLPLVQAISLQNQISLQELGNGAETGLDTIEMQLQQTAEQIGRAFTAPISDPTPPLPVPPIAQRANQGAVFDGSGNLTAGALPASGAISIAMQPVVDAATLALGRTAFGLGAMATEGIGGGLADDGSGNARVSLPLVQVGGNTAIVAGHYLETLVTTGPINLTYARANTYWNGFGHWIVNNNIGAITLAIDSHDTFQGYSSGQAIEIPPNAAAFVSTDAAASGNWLVNWALATAPPMSGGMFSGLFVSNNSGTPNAKIDVSATEITMGNLLAGAVKQRNAAFTIDCATVGLNGMDSGSLPTSGWIYIWAISNGATTGGLASLSSTAPTMPTGYNYRKRLGAMRTDGSAHLLRTRQLGSDTTYAAPPLVASNSATIWTAIGLGGTVPPTAAKVKVTLYADLTLNSNSNIAIVPNNSYTAALPNLSAPLSLGGNVNSTTESTISQTAELLLESTSIYYGTKGSFGTLGISIYGWTDNL